MDACRWSLLVLVYSGCAIMFTSAQNWADQMAVPRTPMRRTVNADYRFQRFPDKNNILFSIDNSYSAAQKQLIRDAAKKVALGSAYCVNFVETTVTDTRFKVNVAPTGAQGSTYCSSWPGQLTQLLSTGKQDMVIIGGQNGCLDSMRIGDVMKYFAILAGRRNEHQRGDRDKYITLNPGSITNMNAYRLYINGSDAIWGFNYDYCSITHNQPTDYAVPGGFAFTPVSGPNAIPRMDQLSNIDCKVISFNYNCDMSKCAPFDCDAARERAAGGVTVAPTTASPGACDMARFCNNSPDESSYVTGPFQLYQTLLMFSGQCVMEYTFDFTNGKLKPNTTPRLITSYFPSPGGPSFRAPVTFAYMKLAIDASSYDLVIENQVNPTTLECTTNGALSTNAATCLKAATSTVAVPVTIGTSATSQLFTGDNTVHHYVVDSTQTSIKLMNEDFTQILQSTGSILTGQTKIAKITAIQILQDEMGNNPVRLAVFGTGTDNVTPYVGFVSDFSLDASPDISLNTHTWDEEPVQLNTILNGC